MAILQFLYDDDDDAASVALHIVPESERELVVIHNHPRPTSVRVAPQLTPIGFQVLYHLVEALRHWPQGLPRSLRCFTSADRRRNGEFLERLISDGQFLVRTQVVDGVLSEELNLPCRLVHALLLMSAIPESQHTCLMCDLPVDTDMRRYPHSLPTAVESCFTDSPCGYWVLSSISLIPGFAEGVFKLCDDHEYALKKLFNDLMTREHFRASSDIIGGRL